MSEGSQASDLRGGRSVARLAAVQALYQMEISGRGAREIVEEFVHHRLGQELYGQRLHEADEPFFTDLVRGVIDRQDDIDQTVNSILSSSWRLERLDSILRALLRTATYELLGRDDVPPKVIINEYVDVAHAFFPAEEVGFVNGALDSIARSRRDLTGAPRQPDML